MSFRQKLQGLDLDHIHKTINWDKKEFSSSVFPARARG